MRAWGRIVAAVALAACSEFGTDPPAAPDGGGVDAGPTAERDGTAPTQSDGGPNDAGPGADGSITDAGDRGPYPDAVLASAPEGYWRMDPRNGNIADVVAGAPDLLLQAGSPQGVDGALARADLAARLDGISFFRASTASSFDYPGTVAFSVEAWVKLEQAGAAGVLVGKAQKDPLTDGQINGWVLSLDASSKLTLILGRFANKVDLRSAALALGWHHTAFTVADSGAVKLYLDGAVVASDTLSVDDRPTALPGVALTVGAAPSTNAFYWPSLKGVVDEVAVYDHALLSDDIAAHIAAAHQN